MHRIRGTQSLLQIRSTEPHNNKHQIQTDENTRRRHSTNPLALQLQNGGRHHHPERERARYDATRHLRGKL